MTEPAVLRTEDQGILELVLNRPDKLNALNGETLAAIDEAIEDLRQNDDLRVMLIRAKGRYFSGGAELSEFGGRTPKASGRKARDWLRRGRRDLRSRYAHVLPSPCRAASRGHGEGQLAVELAAALDSASARQLERLVLSNLVEGAEAIQMIEDHKARLFGSKPA